MARFRRIEVISRIEADGLVPVFFHSDAETAREVALACYRGGARCFEFTHRGDGAHRVFEALLDSLRDEAPEMMLGVGSIGDPYTAALYLAAGANFVVGPVLNPEVAKLCNRRKVAYSPGCGSATEISQAEELGCDIVKVFPGACVGGPNFVKSISGPCPWTSIMPTGGVSPDEESLREWFSVGIVAAGMGSKLFPRAEVESRNWSAIEEIVRGVLRKIAAIRSED